MWNTIKEILKSKKALVAIVSVLVWATGKAGWNLDNDTLLGAVTPLWAFIIAQGVADHGKEAAKARAAAEPTGN
jgi:hypothetical protein